MATYELQRCHDGGAFDVTMSAGDEFKREDLIDNDSIAPL